MYVTAQLKGEENIFIKRRVTDNIGQEEYVQNNTENKVRLCKNIY